MSKGKSIAYKILKNKYINLLEENNKLLKEEITLGQVRKYLGIPDGIRIGQHIYNSNRDLTRTFQVDTGESNVVFTGVDIFNISDKKLLEKSNKFNYE